MMSFRNLFMERPSYYCLSSRLPVTFRLIQRFDTSESSCVV